MSVGRQGRSRAVQPKGPSDMVQYQLQDAGQPVQHAASHGGIIRKKMGYTCK